MESPGPPSSHITSLLGPAFFSYRLSTRLLEAVHTCYLSFLTSISLPQSKADWLVSSPLHSNAQSRSPMAFSPSELILTFKARGGDH